MTQRGEAQNDCIFPASLSAGQSRCRCPPCQVPAWHGHARVFRSSPPHGKGMPAKPEPAQEATYLLKR